MCIFLCLCRGAQEKCIKLEANCMFVCCVRMCVCMYVVYVWCMRMCMCAFVCACVCVSVYV